MKIIVILIILLVLSCNAIASYTVRDNRQLLLVLTRDWSAVNGQMQRYRRDNNYKWVAIGKPIAVVVGKNGLALGFDGRSHSKDPIKREGDLRSPAGIFPIGSAFGFASKTIPTTKIPYIALNPESVCVDDVRSKYYNRIINSSSIKPDWNSAEKMRQVPLYKWGVDIDYNTNKPNANGGSCIFLHIWRSPNKGTAGCVAMSETDLKQVLYWLDSRRQPVITILTEDMFNQYRKAWDLPHTLLQLMPQDYYYVRLENHAPH